MQAAHRILQSPTPLQALQSLRSFTWVGGLHNPFSSQNFPALKHLITSTVPSESLRKEIEKNQGVCRLYVTLLTWNRSCNTLAWDQDHLFSLSMTSFSIAQQLISFTYSRSFLNTAPCSLASRVWEFQVKCWTNSRVWSNSRQRKPYSHWELASTPNFQLQRS